MARHHPFLIAFALVLWSSLAGCGSTSNPAPTCTGTSCACTAGQACDFSPEVCGASCSLACESQSTCAGTCGDSCSIDCGENATCAVTLGASGSTSCKAGSRCDVTCPHGCSMSCADTATCRLKCAGESTFSTVTGGASCPA